MLHPIIKAYLEEDLVTIGGFDRSRLVHAEEGLFVMRAYPASDCGNNVGTVHGGFLLALADIAGTGAVDTYGKENVSMSINANFLNPAFVDDEYLEVTGKTLRRGKRVVVTEVEIKRPDETLVLKATVSVSVFDSNILELERFQHLA